MNRSGRKRAIELGWTNYSPVLPGNAGNHDWGARADVTADGYVGITQENDRVLLSPAQWRAIVRFVREERP